MHLQKQIIKNNLVLRLQGDFDLMITDAFRETVEQVLSSTPIDNIIINLENVSFIDSSGLGVILGRYKQLTQRGGKLFLVNPKPQVKKILEFSGIAKIIRIVMNEEEAFRVS